MKRVLALLGAVALVVGAVALRRTLDAPDDGGGGDGGDTGSLVIACIPELRDLCNDIVRDDAIRFLSPADTIDAIEANEDIDAWVTFDPWPEIADVGSDSAFFATPSFVAHTDLVLATRAGRFDGDCAQAPSWSCVADAQPRDVFVPRLGTALGTILFGWAALDWSTVERPGEPFARQELSLPAFVAFRDTISTAADPLVDALQLGAAGPAAFGATATDFHARVDGTREAANLSPSPGAAPATIAVVVAGPAAERIATDPTFTRALTDVGWVLGPDRSTGLPSAGLMFALQGDS